MHVTFPFVEAELPSSLAALLSNNPNCCGWREYLKLAAWTLPFDRVALLDSEMQVSA